MKKNIKLKTLCDSSSVIKDPYFELLAKSKFGLFYKKYLKRYAPFRYAASRFRLIVNNFYYNLLFSKINKIHSSFKLEKLTSFYYRSDLERHEVTGKFTYEPLDPLVINEKDRALIAASASIDFPPVYLYGLKNTLCISKSNILFCGPYALHHSMYDFNADYTSEELHGRFKIFPKENLIILEAINFNTIAELEFAASFLDACSANYAHWLSEILPKISIFCSLENFKHVPILIDAELHHNLIESLSYCIDDERQVLIVPRGLTVKVKKLYYMDAVGYVPFGHRNGSHDSYHCHGKFHPLGLLSIKKSLSESTDVAKSSAPPRLLYIKRRGEIRKLLNDSEVENYLIQRGFVSVDTSSMSFIEQYHIFKGASVVVGSTGAALANCIFCEPQTKVLVLMGKHPQMIYSYWYKMLSVVKINVGFVFGDIKTRNVDGIHGDFSVSLSDVINSLNAFGVKR